MILQAAIRKNGVVYTLARPARHSDVMQVAGTFTDVNGHERYVLFDGEQGFLDTNRGFVDRRLACNIAKREGQLVKTKYQPNQLFSEDLW